MPDRILPFQKTQYEFVKYIRDPDHNSAPLNIEKRRMDMYRELVFNNIEDFLASNFPVLRKITENDRWEAMVADFLAYHNSKSPYFLHIPEEFLNYLHNEREASDNDFPFLLDLAHYEWVEMAVSFSQYETPPHDPLFKENPLPIVAAVSDTARVLAYRFPVQNISPDYLPQTPLDQPTFLVVYRNADDEVTFLELNPVSYRLLQLIQEKKEDTLATLLDHIAEELEHPNPAVVSTGGKEVICDLIKRRVIRRA